MLVTPQVKRQLRFQAILFMVLFLSIIGLLAWLSTRYVYETDWTASKRNTASATTVALLEQLDKPVIITAFVTSASAAARNEIARLTNLYIGHKANVTVKYVDPTSEPALARERGVNVDGELVIEYDGRVEHLQDLNEQSLTNTLQRLARSGERWIFFLEGHGERNPQGTATFDYTAWGKQLDSKGLKTRRLNLAKNAAIPANAAVLVIADPQTDLLAGEIRIIEKYLADGGNVLWLAEPQSLHGMDLIGEHLGLEFLPGIIVDPNTEALNINDPRFALVSDYSPTAITRDFDTVTLFPGARGIEFNGAETWDAETLLETLPRTWAETGEFNSEISLDPGDDIAGPLVLGLSLTRAIAVKPEAAPSPATPANSNTQQRVVVIGDADFLSDAYLGQGGNLDLSMRILNWLTRDESLLSIPVKTAPDGQLDLSKAAQASIGFGFLIVIPLLLLASGTTIWWRRRKR